MKRILAAFVLLMAGAWASGQVNGQGGVYINGVLQGGGGSSYSYLWSGGISMLAPTTDVAPDPLLLKAANAWPGATTNTTGANTILAGGIGRRIYTIVAYNHGSMAGSTVTITVNGSATVKTEGVNWTAGTSNNATATSLAAAIDAVAGVSATASTAVVRIVPDVGTYSLTIAKTAADAGMTATSGTDGTSDLKNTPILRGVLISDGANNLTYWNSLTGHRVFSVGDSDFRLNSGVSGVFRSMTDVFEFPGTLQVRWTNTNDVAATVDIGLARSAAGVLKMTDGSTGNGNVIASTAITAVGTAAYNGVIRAGVYKRAWTNAEVTAFGAVLSGDLKVATLPAKTVVRNAYLVIDSPAAGTTTLTVSLGRTTAGYIDYIVASNAKVAANMIYGNDPAEGGVNMTGYDLPSVAAATDVYIQFVATGANLDQVTTCTGTLYLMTEVLP